MKYFASTFCSLIMCLFLTACHSSTSTSDTTNPNPAPTNTDTAANTFSATIDGVPFTVKTLKASELFLSRTVNATSSTDQIMTIQTMPNVTGPGTYSFVGGHLFATFHNVSPSREYESSYGDMNISILTSTRFKATFNYVAKKPGQNDSIVVTNGSLDVPIK
jgi:hypothetical protein